MKRLPWRTIVALLSEVAFIIAAYRTVPAWLKPIFDVNAQRAHPFHTLFGMIAALVCLICLLRLIPGLFGELVAFTWGLDTGRSLVAATSQVAARMPAQDSTPQHLARRAAHGIPLSIDEQRIVGTAYLDCIDAMTNLSAVAKDATSRL